MVTERTDARIAESLTELLDFAPLESMVFGGWDLQFSNCYEGALHHGVLPPHVLEKVRADLETRSRVLETVALFRAKVVDVATDAVTVEATGNREKLDALIRVLQPFGIKELVQSGMVAMGRGGRSITDRALRPVERSA